MNADSLRSRYLDFFVKRGHKLFASDSLVPEGDASVLFTGAGMNQFKDAFLGKGPPDLKRATSSQKCIRMPDLDNVGRTPSHHTFFEMLGNFSFGDYFKREAIGWAIEFLEKELGLPRERLAVTVYLEDDEAALIWEKEIGFRKDRIWRFGESDNFWPAEAPSKGPNGPCGPCSEIYFDFGPEATTKKPLESDPANDNKRYVEVWNLVFTQFNRIDVNKLEPLPRKNIDTGMGFERIVRVMQGKATNYDTDLFAPIVKAIGDVSKKRYGENATDDVRIRRIADHVRAASFCISDGVRPGNEGRGYIVRKVIRRASMDLRELGVTEPRLKHIVPGIAEAMGKQYPEIREHQGLIADTIDFDETRFAEVYVQGTEKLKGYLEEATRSGEKKLSGEKVFFLWDTVGLPFDITKRYSEERGVAVDDREFDALMEGQRERARAGSQMGGDIFGTGPASKLKGRVAETTFTGYDLHEAKGSDASTVLAILDDSGELVERAKGNAAFTVILDRTPFYAESGGQVGDVGLLESTSCSFRVRDTKKAEKYHFHVGSLERGELTVGAKLNARVDSERRADTMRNHTATHLLHWALRRVVGAETTQAGSLVHADYLRFDYTSKHAPTAAQLEQIEELVNAQVLKDLGVGKSEKSFTEARAQGAMALFGEKYGDRVRVVAVADDGTDRSYDSVELCGGTHCDRTGQIGVFKIVSDAAIAAGVRRIVAITGRGALRAIREKYALGASLSEMLKAREDELPSRVEGLLAEKARLEKEIAKGKREAALASFDSIVSQGQQHAHGSLFTGRVEGAGHEELRALTDRLLKEHPAAVAVLVGLVDGGASVVVACGKPAVARGIKAGDVCRALCKELGGGGGGRPELAQGQFPGDRLSAFDGVFVRVAASIATALS